MTDLVLQVQKPIELTDAELDFVAGGQNPTAVAGAAGAAAAGLIAAGAGVAAAVSANVSNIANGNTVAPVVVVAV